MLKTALLLFFCSVQFVWAQHEPKSWIVGAQLNTPFANPAKIGGTLQVNHAHNCFTTFINEISIFPVENKTAVEVASSVNLILNNFKRQHFILTGGIGLSVTSLSLTDKQLEDAFFSISNNANENHLSVLIKLKGLYQFKPYWNFVTAVNLKTLGQEFINLSVGLNYEFPVRR